MGSSTSDWDCWKIVIAIFILPAALQVWGTTVNDDWSGSECPHGNNTNNGTTACASTLAEVSQVASNLEIASSAMAMLTVFSGFVSCICVGLTDHKEYAFMILCIGFVGYPIAGILSITGCSLFASKLATTQYGHSFYLCLSAGIIAEIYTAIVCCCACSLLCKAFKPQKRLNLEQIATENVVSPLRP